jgi:hypothetical protein
VSQPEISAPRQCLCGCGQEVARFFRQGHDSKFSTALAMAAVTGELPEHYRQLFGLPQDWAGRKAFHARLAILTSQIRKLDKSLSPTARKTSEWAVAQKERSIQK